MGMRVGYARVSLSGQKLDVRLDRLSDCGRIYHEKASSASAKGRPELEKALDFVRDEDLFVVTKLDRLARSVVDKNFYGHPNVHEVAIALPFVSFIDIFSMTDFYNENRQNLIFQMADGSIVTYPVSPKA